MSTHDYYGPRAPDSNGYPVPVCRRHRHGRGLYRLGRLFYGWSA